MILKPYFARMMPSVTVVNLMYRILHMWTPRIIFVLAVFMVYNIFLGQKRIECATPDRWDDTFVELVQDICLSRAYFFPDPNAKPKQFPPESEPYVTASDKLVAYFTWIPVMLLCQAIVFCLPQYLWNRFNKTNGIAFKELVGNCHENRHCKKQLKTAAKMLKTAVCKDDSYRNMGLLKRLVTGTSLTISYFLCNILTLAMTAAQFFVLAYVLRAPGVMWGFDTLKGLLFPENRISTQFPDSFNCDVWAIRTDKYGKENKYHEMLTCSLPMNSTIEKTVASFWVLLCIAGVAATISIFYWVMVHLFAISRKSFVNSFLRASKVFIGSIDNHVSPSDFCDNFLTPDAILIIRFFEFNGYVILARDLVAQLFMIYAKEQNQQILSLEEGTSGLEEDSASEPVMDSHPDGENIEVQGYESAHEEVIDEISAAEASRGLLSHLFRP